MPEEKVELVELPVGEVFEERAVELTYETKPTRTLKLGKVVSTRRGKVLVPSTYELGSLPLALHFPAPVKVSASERGDELSWSFRSSMHKRISTELRRTKTKEGEEMVYEEPSLTVESSFIACRMERDRIYCWSYATPPTPVPYEEWVKI
jgi:hypothetical protein